MKTNFLKKFGEQQPLCQISCFYDFRLISYIKGADIFADACVKCVAQVVSVK